MGRPPQGTAHGPRWLRAGALVALLATVSEGVRRLVRAPLAAVADAQSALPGPTGVSLEELVAAGCALALASCWCWLVVVVLSVTADAVRRSGGSGRDKGCPRLVRVAVLSLLGVSLGASPALADPGNHEPSAHDARPFALTGLPLPDRATAATGDPSAPDARRAVVRVRPGDSLWSISAGLLAAGATSAAVDRTWRALAAANADRLGPDPDLIFPGTVLRVPDLPSPGKDHS